MKRLEPGDFDYAACYCEENIWRLLAREELADWNTQAVFVFGRGPSVAVYRQRRGRPGDGLILWDYHVFALAEKSGERFVLDFDTRLPFMTGAREYLEAAFPLAGGGGSAEPSYLPLFRLLPAPEYLRRFFSDRGHMRRPDGSWLAPPPPWGPPAGAADGRWTLSDIRSPGEAGPGLLLDREGLLALA